MCRWTRLRQACTGLVAATLLVGAPALLAVVVTAPPASAATTFVVDTTADGAPVASDCTTPVVGSCSLRDAFAAASATADSIISLASGTPYQLTYCDAANGRALRFIANATLVLEGNGATIQQTCALSSANGVITGLNAVDITVRNVTLTGGNSTDGTGGIQAGNDAAAILVENTTITGNTASFQPGVGTTGSLTVRNSTITNNTASAGDGAVRTFNDVAVIINSTITGNTAATKGAGVTSGEGGVTLVYSTVTNNSAPTGANVDVPGANFTSFGSVIASPLGGGANCGAAGTSNGYNYEAGSNTCGFTSGTDVNTGADPQLGALASNGGPTQTLLPTATSPLVDKIVLASCQADGASGVTTDQRGVTRPQDSGCDIGAVELELPAPPGPPGTAVTPIAVVPTFTG